MSYSSSKSVSICNNSTSLSMNDYPTNYYYVVDNTINSLSVNLNNNNIYLVEDNDSAYKVLSDLHKIIEDSCNKYNIVLFILLQNSANVHNNFIELFNEYIQDIWNIFFFNIIIFSHLNKKSYDLITNKQTRNDDILNKYCIGNIYTNRRKTFYKIFNVCTFNITKSRQIVSVSNKNIRYKIIEAPLTNIDKYGISYLTNEYTPIIRCYFGRLLQFTGTCWLNSIINALMLPKISKQIILANIKYYYQTPNDKLSLTELHTNQDNISYTNILSSIIYNIYIKKIKLQNHKSNDFILILASKIKRIIYDQNLMKKHKNAYITERKKYIELTKNYYDNTYGESLISMLQIHVCKFIINNYIKFNSLYKIIEYKQNDEIKMTIDGDKKLISCIISIPGHVICGFICENKEYIFDSNRSNEYIKDNWSSLHFENYISTNLIHDYIALIKDTDLKNYYLSQYNINPNNVIKIKFLIYCKQLTPSDLQLQLSTIKSIKTQKRNINNTHVPTNLTKKRRLT